MKRISKCQSWRPLKGYWVSKLATAVNGWCALHTDYKVAAHAPMIKSELVRRIARQTPHRHQRDVESIVNAILEDVASAMGRSNRVELRGFGTFYVKFR